MRFYGVVSDVLDEAVELFSARSAAEAVVDAWDRDEPESIGELHHGASFERPPLALRGLLTHWSEGLQTRDKPWPNDLSTLTATKSLSDELERQIARHDRVLEHGFVAASDRFMRIERMSRNMYRDERVRHDPDGWKTTALTSLAESIESFLDVYEPYAGRYLGQDWSVTLHEAAVAFAEGPMQQADA